MERINGIPAAIAEIELRYKATINASDRITVTSPRQASEIFRHYWNDDHIELLECFKLLLLNTQCQVLGIIDLCKGSTSKAIADPRIIFAAALKACAKQIILAHNHPSGILKPSPEDIALTKKLSDGAKLLDIKIVDHFILTAEHYYSFSEEGLL